MDFDLGALAGQVVTGYTQIELAKQAGASRVPPPPGSQYPVQLAGPGYAGAYGGYDQPQTAGEKIAAIMSSPTTWLAVAGLVLFVFGIKKLAR